MGLNRILHLAVVWSLAVGTLIAGLPHIDCLCPNGNRKLFCFGSLSDTSSCCCDNGSCCTKDRGCCGPGNHPPDRKPEHTCCSKNAKAKPSQSSETQIQSHSPGCKRTWQPGKVTGIFESTAKLAVDFNDGPIVLLPTSTLDFSATNEGQCLLSFKTHPIPPPTDLVVTLQHFVI